MVLHERKYRKLNLKNVKFLTPNTKTPSSNLPQKTEEWSGYIVSIFIVIHESNIITKFLLRIVNIKKRQKKII